MSDDRLRELERAWREAGDVASEARWLRARLRAGELDPARVELAAGLGHPAAARVLDRTPGRPDLAELAAALAAGGREACVRAVVGLAWMQPVQAPPFEGPNDRLLEVLDALDAWAAEPTPEREASAAAAGEAAAEAAQEGWYAGRASAIALRACWAIAEPGLHARHAEDALAESAGDEASRRAWVRDEVAPWALGERDPAAERVARRGRRLGREAGIVRALTFGPAGDLLVSASDAGTLTVWSVAPPRLVRRWDHPARRQVVGVACSAEGWLAWGDEAGAVTVADLGDGRPVATLTAGEGWVDHLAFLPGGRLLTGCDGAVATWSLPAARVERRIEVGERLTALAVRPDGRAVLVSDGEATAVHDLSSGARLAGWEGGARTAAWLDEARVAVGDGGREAELREAADGAVVCALGGHDQGITVAVAAPDGARVAAAGTTGGLRRSGQVIVWDAAGGGRELARREWSSCLLTLAWSPAGDLVAGGARSGALRLYVV